MSLHHSVRGDRKRSSRLSGVTTAILSGGLGTRLRPVIADRPKVLAEIRGRPFLSYLLDQVAAAGVESVVLCTGYLGEQVQTPSATTMATCVWPTPGNALPLGLAVRCGGRCPYSQSDPVLVLNGDSFCDLDLEDFWRFHRVPAAVGSLALTEMDDTRRYGRVLLEADGTISGFAEKAETSGPGWINAGMYLLSQRCSARFRRIVPFLWNGRFFLPGRPGTARLPKQRGVSWTSARPKRMRPRTGFSRRGGRRERATLCRARSGRDDHRRTPLPLGSRIRWN